MNDDFALSALTSLMRSSGLLTDADMAELASLSAALPPLPHQGIDEGRPPQHERQLPTTAAALLPGMTVDTSREDASLESLIQSVLSKPEESSDRFFELLSAIDRHNPVVDRHALDDEDQGDNTTPKRKENAAVQGRFDVAAAVQRLQATAGGTDDSGDDAVAMLEAFLLASSSKNKTLSKPSPGGASSGCTPGGDDIDDDGDGLETTALPAEPGSKQGSTALGWIQSTDNEQSTRLRTVQFDNFVVDDDETDVVPTVPQVHTEHPVPQTSSSSSSGGGSSSMKDQPAELNDVAADDDDERQDEDTEEDEEILLPDAGSPSAAASPLPRRSTDRELLDTLRREVVESCRDEVESFTLDNTFDYETNIQGRSRRGL